MTHTIVVYIRGFVWALGYALVLCCKPERIFSICCVAATLTTAIVPNWARNILVFAVCADAKVRMSFWTLCRAVAGEPIAACINALTANVTDHIRPYFRCLFWADTHTLFQFGVPESAAVWQLTLSAGCSAPNWSRKAQLLTEFANIIGIVRLLAPLGTTISSPVRQCRRTALAYPIESVYRKCIWACADTLIRDWIVEQCRPGACCASRSRPQWRFGIVLNTTDTLSKFRIPNWLSLIHRLAGGAGPILPNWGTGIQFIAVFTYVVLVCCFLAKLRASSVFPVPSSISITAGPARLASLVPYRRIH